MRAIVLGLAALLALLLGGAVARAQGQAGLRVVHAALNAGAVDLYLDGELIVAVLPPGQASAYGRLAPGAHTLSVHRAGLSGDEGLLQSQSLELTADRGYTLVLAEDNGGLAGFLFSDELEAGAGDGPGSLRLVNALTDGARIALAADGVALTPLIGPGEASDRALAPSAEPAVTVLDGRGGTILTTQLPLGRGDFYTLVVAGRSIQPTQILVSYPLGAGALAGSESWLGEPTIGETDGAGERATIYSTAVPPPRPLPDTGLGDLADGVPLLLMVNGFLLVALGAVVAAWLQQRQAL